MIQQRPDKTAPSPQERMARLEAELEATRKELSWFTFAVAHDVRAPLRTIEGFAKALTEDHAEALGEQGLDYLQRVRGAATRMAVILDAIMELSEVDRVELHQARVDLTLLAESVAAQLRQSNPARIVGFRIEPGLSVDGDPALLRICLEQLFGNSWKFTSHHPSATIDFGAEERQGARLLYLRDDGAGFDEAYASKLFTAFQRLHAASEFEGIGIGLAIVRRIIHRHGGRVWASGRVEQGATVYIELP